METDAEPIDISTVSMPVDTSDTPPLDSETTPPGSFQVIRRNGKVTHFDPSKITVAVTKAFLAVEGGSAAASGRIHDTVKALTDQVVMALTLPR